MLQRQQISHVQSNVELGHSCKLSATDRILDRVQYSGAWSLVHLLQGWHFLPSAAPAELPSRQLTAAGSKTAVGAEGRGTLAAGVLGTEPVRGSGDTPAGRACCTGRRHTGCSPWAWASDSTRDTLGRWGTVAPGPAEEGLSWGLGEERLPGRQHPQEPGQWQKESYWPEVQEAGAGLGAEALKAAGFLVLG